MKANQQFSLTPAQVKEIRKMARESGILDFQLVKDGREFPVTIRTDAHTWAGTKYKLAKAVAHFELYGYEVFRVSNPDQKKSWLCDIDYNTNPKYFHYYA